MNGKKRILFIDDNKSVCEIIKMRLSQSYEVDIRYTTQEQQSKDVYINRNPLDDIFYSIDNDEDFLKGYDIIMADLVINGKNGLDLYKKVKQADPTKTVVIFTGTYDTDNLVNLVYKAMESYNENPNKLFLKKDIHMSNPIVMKERLEEVEKYVELKSK